MESVFIECGPTISYRLPVRFVLVNFYSGKLYFQRTGCRVAIPQCADIAFFNAATLPDFAEVGSPDVARVLIEVGKLM